MPAHDHAVQIPGVGKSLSVLATPEDQRDASSYKLSADARTALRQVLAEDPDELRQRLAKSIESHSGTA